jgi:hypothetical protein
VTSRSRRGIVSASLRAGMMMEIRGFEAIGGSGERAEGAEERSQSTNQRDDGHAALVGTSP